MSTFRQVILSVGMSLIGYRTRVPNDRPQVLVVVSNEIHEVGIPEVTQVLRSFIKDTASTHISVYSSIREHLDAETQSGMQVYVVDDHITPQLTRSADLVLRIEPVPDSDSGYRGVTVKSRYVLAPESTSYSGNAVELLIELYNVLKGFNQKRIAGNIVVISKTLDSFITPLLLDLQSMLAREGITCIKDITVLPEKPETMDENTLVCIENNPVLPAEYHMTINKSN